jgi:hypothetical protein
MDMRKLERSGITLLVLIGLLAGATVAWADTDDAIEIEIEDLQEAEAKEETLFNFGYDMINRILVWGLSALDGVYDCTLDGPYTATYGTTGEQGGIPVDNLEDGAGVVSFPNRPPEEVDDELEPADAPVEYSGADGDCGVSGGEVSGPNGQVNHGMFMKLFNSLYEGTGRGCVVRHLAQSDLGKGEQQVQVGGEAVDPVGAGDTGTVDFTSVEADCEHGKAVDDSADSDLEIQSNGNGNGNGRPDHAGKPDQAGSSSSPGNSGSAPGHNK